MDSPIDPHQLSAFYPSAVRSMAAAAQMSQYTHGQQGTGVGHISGGVTNSGGSTSSSAAPYASIFAAAAAAATAVSPDPFVPVSPFRSRLEVRDLRSAMLHHYSHQSQFHPVSSSPFMVDRSSINSTFNSNNNNSKSNSSVKLSSDTGSLSPSTDGGDSIAEPLMCNDDSPTSSLQNTDHDHKGSSYDGHIFDNALTTVSPNKMRENGKSDLLSDHPIDSSTPTSVATKKARLSKSVSRHVHIVSPSLCRLLFSSSLLLPLSLHPLQICRNILMHIHPVHSMYVSISMLANVVECMILTMHSMSCDLSSHTLIHLLYASYLRSLHCY